MNPGPIYSWFSIETRDGQLTERELLAVPALTENWDLNEDGELSLPEIARVEIRIVQGVETSPEAERASPTKRLYPVVDPPPSWFAGMDRNQDGDISRREFPGSEGLFQKLDVDGDGFIDAGEARSVKP